MEKDINIYGYMMDASYRHYIPDVLGDFAQSFPGVEKLILDIKEEVVINPNIRRKPFHWFHPSEDGKELRIEFHYQRYIDRKGNLTKLLTPSEALRSLRGRLESAASHYQELLDQTDEEE